jgi:hypothetical protein
MAKLPTTEILPQELEAVFQALEVWQKITDGRLSDEVIVPTRVASWDFVGGVSEIVRHKNEAGYQVATTHRIVMPDGTTPHWDGKDIRLGDVILWAK